MIQETPAYTRVPVAHSFTTVLPDLDFETYSEAGYYLDPITNKRKSIVASPPHGLGAVGASVYTQHPTAEVLSLAYNLKDGLGPRLWVPGMAPPQDLFDHIAAGHLLEAFNSMFEYNVWLNICGPRMGWQPNLPLKQLRDAMAKSRAFSLPGALKNVAAVLEVKDLKIADGKRLLDKFSIPRSPTKKDPRWRIRPEEDLEDADKLYNYNLGDIKTESAVSLCLPDLSPTELELWLLDQEINARGCYIDPEALQACLHIIEKATKQYTAELVQITGGTVNTASEVQKLGGWLGAQGVQLANMQAETVEKALKRTDLPENARRVLEIRSSLGAASVKKLFALDRRISSDGRIKDMFVYCGADRTDRFAGRGPQPQNLPNSGPEVAKCDVCSQHFTVELTDCPWCFQNHTLTAEHTSTPTEWSIQAVGDALRVIMTGDLPTVEYYFGDAVAAVSGCLRGLFSAAPGHDLICSDYSAIEAVVLACLAGEQWRIDVFNSHGKIYEMSAAKLTGIPFQEFLDHKTRTGDHHPMRKKIGKVGELASGYCGWIGAWKNFGADKYFNSDNEIKDAILAWRRDSPAIEEFWGGQVRKHPDRWEWWHDIYGIEGYVVTAIQNPTECYDFRGLKIGIKNDVLYIQLLSGRNLYYHSPRLVPQICSRSKLETYNITYKGWNSDHLKGPIGWITLDTYGGKLTENIVQSTARDILTYAMPKLEAAGYPIVLHVHDEVVSEVPEGTGSVEEFETIMATLPEWCADWPIKAAGGWRGKRYRKD